MSLETKFVSFDRLKRYTQHVKSYVGQQILNAKGEWAKQLNLKVDKVEGKGLSTNDFTTELKNKLNGIEAGAQVNTVTGIKGNAESAYRKGDVNLTPANIGAVASSDGDASNTKVTFAQSTSRVNLASGDTLKTAFGKLSKWFVDLKAVAFSGSYNDLSNKPTTLKNPKSLTIRQNGGNQTEYDGSTALTVNITKAGIGLGNVENKSSATIRDELTSVNVTKALGFTPISKVTVDSALSSSSTNPVQNKVVNAALSRKLTKTINEYNAETICLCTHSKSGTVHTLVKKNSNDYYSTVKFVATADFTYGDTFRLGSASSPTVVTPKTEDGKPLNTGAFKKGSVVIAYTGDTTETVHTLFFKGGGGVDISGATATATDVAQGKTFFGKDGAATGAVPRYTKKAPKTASILSGGLALFIDSGLYGYYGQSGKQDPYIEFDAGTANVNQVLDNATFTSNSGLLQQGARVYLGPTPIFDCERVDTDNADSSIYLRPRNGSEYFAFDRGIQVSLRSLAQTGLPIIILIGSGFFQVDYPTRQNFGYAQNPGEVNVDISDIRYTNTHYDASDLSYTMTLSITLTVSVGSYTSTQLVVLNNVKIKSFT